MTNRVYYGEYSLAYWVELILTKKILLPGYQRHFVWNKEQVKAFIEALKEKRFVPPVTIGAFKDNGNKQNIIIDGQQRLTSVLLAYLCIFPNKEWYKAHLAALANGDEEEPDDGTDPYDNVLEWNFNKLTEKGSLKEDILNKLEPNNYQSMNLGLNEETLKSTFIGFSYIVPAVTDSTEQQKYYSKMFRDINQKGINLLELESRKALYFLNAQLDGYFEPPFLDDYYVAFAAGTQQKMDFVRYLSMLATYEKSGQRVNKVARGYRSCMEKYYEEYIYSVVEGQYEEKFGRLEDIFNNRDYTSEVGRLEKTILSLDLPKVFPSIINMDIYFFGLIYYVLFKHREIDNTRKAELKTQLNSKIEEFRANPKHAVAPAQMGHLRNRLMTSIDIYTSFLKP